MFGIRFWSCDYNNRKCWWFPHWTGWNGGDNSVESSVPGAVPSSLLDSFACLHFPLCSSLSGPRKGVRGCLPLFFLLLPFRSNSDNSRPVPQEKGSPGPLKLRGSEFFSDLIFFKKSTWILIMLVNKSCTFQFCLCSNFTPICPRVKPVLSYMSRILVSYKC